MRDEKTSKPVLVILGVVLCLPFALKDDSGWPLLAFGYAIGAHFGWIMHKKTG